MQVTTEDIKKEDRLCMKSPSPDAYCATGVFKVQPPISCAKFSSKSGSTWGKLNTTKPLKPLNLSDKSFHSFKELSGLCLQVSIPPVGESFQIYSVQITGKCIYETTPQPPPTLNIIWSLVLSFRNPPHKFLKKSLSPHEIFF